MAIVPDTEQRGLLTRLPSLARDLMQLARFDRPIGAWLLFWPGAWSVALAGGAWSRLGLIGWLAVGSLVMRAAGCVYNDIVDRDLDTRVARTRDRPLASRRVPLSVAWGFIAVLCLGGLVVLLQLGRTAQVAALASIAPVAAYPFMKRITWWPQAWLGIVFSWAGLVGWPAVTGGFAAPALWLYAGAVIWVIGYDTIYAVQDLEDDALAGVRSSARALGGHVRGGVAVCYIVALALWGTAFWQLRADPLVLLALLPMAAHFAWQVTTLDVASGENALTRFRANRFAGLLMFCACMVVGGTA